MEYETDRARFLGRGRTPANPAALDAGTRLSGTTGPVLDPVFSLRRRVRLEPGGTGPHRVRHRSRRHPGSGHRPGRAFPGI